MLIARSTIISMRIQATPEAVCYLLEASFPVGDGHPSVRVACKLDMGDDAYSPEEQLFFDYALSPYPLLENHSSAPSRLVALTFDTALEMAVPAPSLPRRYGADGAGAAYCGTSHVVTLKDDPPFINYALAYMSETKQLLSTVVEGIPLSMYIFKVSMYRWA